MSTDEQILVNKQQKIDPIFELLKEKKIDEAIKYIEDGLITQIDCIDEHGTTPLQYAAFRGWRDFCEFLIKKGADVNAKTHDQGYTALMFAAISNHKSVVKLLLENDADADYTNMINRTATQMAAFVNSNECVDIINSYVSKKDLEYYTEVHSLTEKEPKLPKGECLNELHKLLTSSSHYSPIRVLKSIKQAKNNVLMLNAERIIKTLDAFSCKSFKNENGDCPNDLLAYKLHLYKYYFEYVINTRKTLLKKVESSTSEGSINKNLDEIDAKAFEYCFKQLANEEEITIKTDGLETKKIYRVFEEKFLRESIRQFPYPECALIKQMVTILSRVQIGNHPSAFYVITSCLNGQRLNESFDKTKSDENDEETKESKRIMLECGTCYFKSYDCKMCTHCKKVAYCDQICQKLNWPFHKKMIF